MDNQLIGALEAGGTKMVCATGYANGTIVEQTELPTTTPDETMGAVTSWFSKRDIKALGIGAFGPTAVNPSSPQYGKILETPKTAWRYFDILRTIMWCISPLAQAWAQASWWAVSLSTACCILRRAISW